jgi:hypothetical protein
MKRMRTGTTLLCALACLAAASGASAGQYHVYSCRTPSGAPAPTDGWASSVSGVSDVAEDSCKGGGALVAALGDGVTHEVGTDHATWAFALPPEILLTGAQLWRAGDADGGWATNATYEFWIAGPHNEETAANVIDSCVAEFGCPTGTGSTTQPESPSNLVTVLPENIGAGLYANVSCGGTSKFSCPSGKGDANNYAAVVYLYAADLTLEQTSQPVVTHVTGELANASTLSGTADLSFEAGDSGSGVYQAVFDVDGAVVGRTLLDENGGRCRDVGGASDGLPAFLYLQPCAGSLSADVPFDTTALADGTHHLIVSVVDAAGNAAVALDRRVEVANHAAVSAASTTSATASGTPAPPALAPNGSPASAAASLSARWTPGGRSALRARLGSARAVRGRLLAPGGVPIAGAAVQAQFLPACLGASPRQLPAARTGADGAFALRVPASLPSGRLTLSYAARVGQAAPDVSAALTLTVPALLRLRVSPGVSHAGGTIRFAGVLRGAPLPHGGKQLVLEARVAGPGGRSAWRQFRVLASGPHGAFRASYRFRLPGPVVYQFRALSPREADFPYAQGASNVVSVFER